MRAQQSTERTSYIEAACILACFCVVYDLAVGRGCLLAAATPSFTRLFEYNLGKPGVPLLLMAAGARLFCCTDPWRTALWRIVRIVLALALFTLAHYAVYCAQTGVPFDVLEGLYCVYYDALGLTDSYSVLYQYLGVLVTLPLLQRMMPRMRCRDILYYLAISSVLLPCIHSLSTFVPGIVFNTRLEVTTFCGMIGCMVLGYFVDRYGTRRPGGTWAALGGVLLFAAIGAIVMQLALQITPEHALRLDYMEKTTAVLSAGCMFYALKCVFEAHVLSPRTKTILCDVARLTLCVYLLAELMTEALSGASTWLTAQTAPGIGALMYAILVYVCCIAAAFALTRLPFIKKLL